MEGQKMEVRESNTCDGFLEEVQTLVLRRFGV